MHIDWFVFAAQIVNFLILFWLLKKFLYGRILGAIDAREAKIAATFSEAEKAREEARESAAECKARLEEMAVRNAPLTLELVRAAAAVMGVRMRANIEAGVAVS